MINQGIWKDITWNDKWTSATADGQRSAQFEHTLLITEDGVEILTAPLDDSPPLEFMVQRPKGLPDPMDIKPGYEVEEEDKEDTSQIQPMKE